MILPFTPEEAERDMQQLANLLMDAVASGASIGFMPPLEESEALNYWRSVIAAMRDGSRILLVAADGDLIQGSVQIGLEMRANGNHRAEAMKLSVHGRAARQGLPRALMADVEGTAAPIGVTFLLMASRT